MCPRANLTYTALDKVKHNPGCRYDKSEHRIAYACWGTSNQQYARLLTVPVLILLPSIDDSDLVRAAERLSRRKLAFDGDRHVIEAQVRKQHLPVELHR